MVEIIIFMAALAAQAETGTRYIHAIPDLTQTDERIGSTGTGDRYCAPVSVSNSLMYFAENGYPRLAPASSSLRQIELVHTLASKPYMSTGSGSGTSKEGILRGVNRYVTERGYMIDTIEYRGLEIYLDSKQPSESTRPSMDWLREGLDDRGAVWVQVGWYRHDESTNIYQKTGGHWVTLVGYGVDESGNANDAILILHDPAPRAGIEFANEFVRAERIDEGKLHGYGLPQDASGFYLLSDGMHVHEDADLAILEGAIRLRLRAP